MASGTTREPARFVVYGLVDPRDGRVHYVGATKNLKQRVSLHRLRDGGGSGSPRRAWLEDLRVSGRWPFWVVVLQETTDALKHEVEREWIRRGLDLGWPLTNTHGIPVPPPDVRGSHERRAARDAFRIARALSPSLSSEAAR